MEETFDVIILGAGPAGLTAGIYTSRHSFTTLILEGGKIGGKACEANWIENYPGFPYGISGFDLMDKIAQQAANFGAKIREETVYGVSKFNNRFMVSTRSGAVYQSKSIIIATGVNRKPLDVLGENEFKGRGVSYCGICDGPFFRDKTVAVLGSGKDAIHDIELLLKTSARVYGVPGKEGYDQNLTEIEHLRRNPKFKLQEGVEVSEIGGEDFVKYMVLDDGSRLDVDGVFVILQQINMSWIFDELGVETDKDGCILTDKKQKTNIPGVFAAGDCCCNGFQVVTATGMGAIAALNTMKYIKSPKEQTNIDSK